MKTISAFVLSMLLAGAAYAQSPITFGPKFGISYSNLSSIKSENRFKSDYYTGFNGGLFIRATISKIYVQPEAYFNFKGSNLAIKEDPNNPNSNDVNGKIRLSTLDVPVMVGVKLVSGKVFNLRAMGGPVASFKLDERKNDLRTVDPDSYQFNKSNVGYQAGVGFDIGNVTFDARYEGGLNKINSSFSQRNNLFLFSVGIKLL